MSVDPEDQTTSHASLGLSPLRKYWQAIRAFSPDLRRFLLAIFLTTTVFIGLVAVLQNLYLLRLGFDARFIGLLLGTGQVVWALTALPAGWLTNRIGLRNGILLGQNVAALGLVLMLLVERQPEGVWRAWLLVSQAVIMLGITFITVTIPSFLMAVTEEKERRYAFAALQAIIPASAFVGSVSAGLLPGFFAGWLELSLEHAAAYRWALSLGPLVIVMSSLLLLGITLPRSSVAGSSPASSSPAPLGWFLFFGVFVFLHAVGEGSVRAFFNVYLDTVLVVPTAQIGMVIGLAQLLPIVAALSVPLLMNRFGTGYTLLIGIVGISLCLLPLATTPSLALAALAFMGVVAMVTVINAARDLFGQEMVQPDWRTSSQGVAIVGLSLGWATAGLLGGFLIESRGFAIVFLIGAVLAFIAAGLLLAFLRQRRPALTVVETVVS